MKNINETVKSKYLIYILFLAGGLLLGWLLFHNSDTDSIRHKRARPARKFTTLRMATTSNRTRPASGLVPCIPKFAKTSRVNALSAPWIDPRT